MSADITVSFSVFLDLKGFSFFIIFQAFLVDRVKSTFSIDSLHFFICFLEGMFGVFLPLYCPRLVCIPSVVLQNVLSGKGYIVLCVLVECLTLRFLA